MRAYVFTDPTLTKRAGQFVWLSIDTEKAQNAPFTKKYPIKAWPSMYVIDPVSEKVVLRWVGGATVAELDKLFDDGQKAMSRPAASTESLAKADALFSDGKYEESIPVYRSALKTLPKTSPSYARAVESLLYDYTVPGAKQPAECVTLARSTYPALRGTTAGAAVAGQGLDCALHLPEGAQDRAAHIAALEKDAREVLADPNLHLAADDRSALYESLHDVREEAHDAEGAERVAKEWVTDLDAAARNVKTPEQLTALDPNRLSAYAAAGELEKAIPMLEKSEKDFPDDYNPPARLAHVYLKLKRYDEALKASDQAMAKVYGPRKLRVYAERADIYAAMGNEAAARKTVQDALAYAESLPPGQRSESAIASLKQQLAGSGGK
ncbi:MAG TPA: tetratricopeptide repeat protein [Thermoanaerobaculia bacterium]|nr:tetratricopeptide repeat protein [Thermoanaerobaculia bacterium]